MYDWMKNFLMLISFLIFWSVRQRNEIVCSIQWKKTTTFVLTMRCDKIWLMFLGKALLNSGKILVILEWKNKKENGCKSNLTDIGTVVLVKLGKKPWKVEKWILDDDNTRRPLMFYDKSVAQVTFFENYTFTCAKKLIVNSLDIPCCFRYAKV